MTSPLNSWIHHRPLPLHPWHPHSRQPARKAFLAHVFKHLLHLSVLAEKIVNLLHRGAGAAGDAFAAAAVDDLVVVTLVHRHRVDDRFYAVDLIFVDLVRSFLEAG